MEVSDCQICNSLDIDDQSFDGANNIYSAERVCLSSCYSLFVGWHDKTNLQQKKRGGVALSVKDCAECECL